MGCAFTTWLIGQNSADTGPTLLGLRWLHSPAWGHCWTKLNGHSFQIYEVSKGLLSPSSRQVGFLPHGSGLRERVWQVIRSKCHQCLKSMLGNWLSNYSINQTSVWGSPDLSGRDPLLDIKEILALFNLSWMLAILCSLSSIHKGSEANNQEGKQYPYKQSCEVLGSSPLEGA
jgi:hypothetical protein